MSDNGVDPITKQAFDEFVTRVKRVHDGLRQQMRFQRGTAAMEAIDRGLREGVKAISMQLTVAELMYVAELRKKAENTVDEKASTETKSKASNSK